MKETIMSSRQPRGSKDDDSRGSGRELINTLIADLKVKDGIRRQNARRRLVAMGKQSLPFLAKLLEDHQEQTRWEAAKALGAIADPEASSALTSALEDEEFDVRWLAAEGLIRLGRDGLPSLFRALAERPNSVWLREGAHHILTTLSKKRMKTLLKPMLSALVNVDPETHVPEVAHALLNMLQASKGPGKTK
jgi:HEAT repeat protein